MAVGAERTVAWRRSHGRVALVLGLAALGAALLFAMWRRPPPHTPTVRLTPGPLDTTRAVVARKLAAAAATRGVRAHLVEAAGTREELEMVERGEADFALVSGAYRFGSWPEIRQVAPLYVEALHLLVKRELLPAVTAHIGALAGHTIDVGVPHTTSAGLAAAVLAFTGVGENGRAPTIVNIPWRELEPEVMHHDRAALPDAMFILATLPSKLAAALVREADYRLIPMPFAEAFRLDALITEGPAEGPASEIERQHVVSTVVPAFTYSSEPAVPEAPLETLGARLLLVAGARVPPEDVEAVLAAVFSPRFARVVQPPLEPSVLSEAPRLELHPGTVAYIARNQPAITDETVDKLNNSIGILTALIGGGLFLWQWWRKRTEARLDEVFGGYMLRVAAVERRAAELELGATLALEPLIDLQREVLQLKSEALERFAAGDLGGQAALSDLLGPLNGARNHIGELLLHVRDNLEDQAEAEGRKASALWTEELAKGPPRSGSK